MILKDNTIGRENEDRSSSFPEKRRSGKFVTSMKHSADTKNHYSIDAVRGGFVIFKV
jgi:uncharacterized protein YtpQ (UPF0354 family)